jgi:hypothetical protein
MILDFTDNDFAVIQDSLGTNRERIRDMGHPTPNMDETMKKWGRWAKPSGCQFTVVTGNEVAAMLSKEALAVVVWTLIEHSTDAGLETTCDVLDQMPVAADPDAARLIAVMREEISNRKATTT